MSPELPAVGLRRTSGTVPGVLGPLWAPAQRDAVHLTGSHGACELGMPSGGLQAQL